MIEKVTQVCNAKITKMPSRYSSLTFRWCGGIDLQVFYENGNIWSFTVTEEVGSAIK